MYLEIEKTKFEISEVRQGVAMFEEAIDNTVFLKATFGAMPELQRIIVSRIAFELPDSIAVTFKCTEPAKKLPLKWKDFDTVGMTVRFFTIADLNLNASGEGEEPIPAELTISRAAPALWQASFGGGFQCSFLFRIARADDFFPALLAGVARYSSSATKH